MPVAVQLAHAGRKGSDGAALGRGSVHIVRARRLDYVLGLGTAL